MTTTQRTAAELTAMTPEAFLPVITRADRVQAWLVGVMEGHLGYYDNHIREYYAQDDASVRHMLWQEACWEAIQREGDGDY